MKKREILNNAVKKASGKGSIMGPYDPYRMTMVPVPAYVTTGTPTPAASTSVNYNARTDNNGRAARAISKIDQFDRAPVKKDPTNKYVGTKDDNQKLRNAHTEILSKTVKKAKNNNSNKALNVNSTSGSFIGQNSR